MASLGSAPFAGHWRASPAPSDQPKRTSPLPAVRCRPGLDQGSGGRVGQGSSGRVGPPSLSRAWPWEARPDPARVSWSRGRRRVEGDHSVTPPAAQICQPLNQIRTAPCRELLFDVGNCLLVRRPAGIASCPGSPPARAHQSWQSIQVLPFRLPAVQQHAKDKNQAALQKPLPPPRPFLRAGSRPGQSQAPSGIFPLGPQLLPFSP